MLDYQYLRDLMCRCGAQKTYTHTVKVEISRAPVFEEVSYLGKFKVARNSYTNRHSFNGYLVDADNGYRYF